MRVVGSVRETFQGNRTLATVLGRDVDKMKPERPE
jgi:hypothetical protein